MHDKYQLLHVSEPGCYPHGVHLKFANSDTVVIKILKYKKAVFQFAKST